jgi:hypothetical protein
VGIPSPLASDVLSVTLSPHRRVLFWRRPSEIFTNISKWRMTAPPCPPIPSLYQFDFLVAGENFNKYL